MNYPGHAADPWSYPGDAGEAAATAAAGDTSSFADMIAEYSIDDLFELVGWEQGAGGGAGASGSTTTQPAACLWSPRFEPPAEARFDPPSEDEMAAWLCTIVKGEKLDGGGRQHTAGGQDVPAKGSSDDASTTDTKEKLPITEGTGTKLEIRKPPAGGSSRRSHHGEAHNLTEKRRRNKINERLRTLQQLVPGCDKSNQASTLDQTIKYIKSLQQHVQAMSVGPARPAPAVVYPVVQPQYVPPGAPVAMPMPAAPMVLGPPPTMVPFWGMLQLPQYPVLIPAAAAAPLYPAVAPPRAAAVAPGGASSRSSASRRQGSSSSKGKGGSRSLRQKH